MCFVSGAKLLNSLQRHNLARFWLEAKLPLWFEGWQGAAISHQSASVRTRGNLMQNTIVALLLLASPALAFAGNANPDVSNRVPEPETLALLVGAAVAVGIVRWIRRK